MSQCPRAPCGGSAKPLVVVITGAAGQIGYSLAYMVSSGHVFGCGQPLELRLLDLEVMLPVMKGVIMELMDCAMPALTKVVATASEEEAFKDADYVMLVGAMPRKEGMERKDLLRANAKIFKSQGQALDKHAKKSVKILVVGNPANTNCYICRRYAPSLPDTAFSCLTRLDHNRANAQVAAKCGVSVCQVQGLAIWGNHSVTQYPDVSHASVYTPGKDVRSPNKVTACEAINDETWIKNDFLTTVQKRGGAVLAARKSSSAMSAAKAVCDHMHDWHAGTGTFADGTPGYVSMGVPSDGSYGIPKGIVYSFPCKIVNGVFSVIQDLPINDFSRQKMDASLKELEDERTQADEICNE